MAAEDLPTSHPLSSASDIPLAALHPFQFPPSPFLDARGGVSLTLITVARDVPDAVRAKLQRIEQGELEDDASDESEIADLLETE
ncbi:MULTISPECIES: hypothetical protein [Halorussus]|uniref:hypothetical protein n=1 Tax=Halorussus TaxID=1070314 RepID=UPI0013B43657|nr:MULTISPECIES: hypothetical protein [Halorussus]NHN58948.1 hypothetical protein [Halorussus sp. JP-T4]